MASAYPQRGEAGHETSETMVDPMAAHALLQGFMSFPMAMSIDREDGRVVQANDAFLSLLGLESHDVTGQRPTELGLRDLKPQAKTKAVTRSTRLLMPDGRVLRCDSRKIEGGAADLFVSTYAVEGGQSRPEEG
ncbi:MAG: PAS domain-containing protein, partial [Methanomassiliicoccales archaeon]